MKTVFNVRSDRDFRAAREYFERNWDSKPRWIKRLRDLGCRMPTEDLWRLPVITLSQLCDELLARDTLAIIDNDEESWR